VPDLPLLPHAHAAPLPPAREIGDGVSVLDGVPYAALPGARPLELDLYLPAARPAPVVVFVHGGGWRLGSRHSAGPAFPGTSALEAVAQAGIAVASVDHRLSGEAVWPAQLHDVKAAVRWLRARAGDLGVDPERVYAWGESAGGHLAALLGLTAGDPELEGDVGVTGPSSAVAAVAAGTGIELLQWALPLGRVVSPVDATLDAAGAVAAGVLGGCPASGQEASSAVASGEGPSRRGNSPVRTRPAATALTLVSACRAARASSWYAWSASMP
jgi:BD-FAE protein